MGYSGAVGMMVLDEVAFLNERLENRIDWLSTDLTKVENKVKVGQVWSRGANELIDALEVEVGGLWAQNAMMRGSMDQMRTDGCADWS